LSACEEEASDPGQELPPENMEQEETVPDEEYSITVPYEYPEPVGNSNHEMMESCNIPEDILKNMDTPALIESILRYPLLASFVDMASLPPEPYKYAVDLQLAEKHFNAIPELYGRKDGIQQLEKKNALLQEKVEAYSAALRMGEKAEDIHGMDLICARIVEVLLEEMRERSEQP
ncbi:MAG: hypothetical protein Q4B50_05120, partial [Bacillota bacterium]|nr:hypothetical protein [Bacillota bacterium]